MKASKILCLFLAAVMLLGFAACSKPQEQPKPDSEAVQTEPPPAEETAPPSSTPEAEHKEEKVLRIRINEELFLNGSLSSVWLWDCLTDRLLYMDPTEPENIKGCLAESWSHSDDYLTWKFQIKENVYFSDGTLCDAKAICEAFDTKLKLNLSGWSDSFYSEQLCRLTNWYASGEYELTMELSQPCAWFETQLCQSSFSIKSPTAVKLYGTLDDRSLVGTGPYIYDGGISDVETNEKWAQLRANKNYHMSERYPDFDVIYLDFNRTENETYPPRPPKRSYEELFTMLDNGELDVVVFGLTNIENICQYDEIVPLCEQRGYALHTYTSRSAGAMWFNPTVFEPFMSADVREAVCRLIDLDALNAALYSGQGKVQSSIWADGRSSAVPFDGYYTSPEEGLALLAEAGYECSDIVFTSQVLDSGHNRDIMRLISAQLEQYGIQMDVKLHTTGVYSPGNNAAALNIPLNIEQIYGSGPHALWRGVMSDNDYDPMPYVMTGSRYDCYKFSWQEIYAPDLYARMCEIYDRMMSTPSWNEMVECSRELTRIVQEDYAALPLVQEPVFFAVREGAEELFEAFTETSMFNLMYQ